MLYGKKKTIEILLTNKANIFHANQKGQSFASLAMQDMISQSEKYKEKKSESVKQIPLKNQISDSKPEEIKTDVAVPLDENQQTAYSISVTDNYFKQQARKMDDEDVEAEWDLCDFTLG